MNLRGGLVRGKDSCGRGMLSTRLRAPIAALLAYAATSQLSLGKQLLATVLGGLIAFAAHGGKITVRAAVTPSPETNFEYRVEFG